MRLLMTGCALLTLAGLLDSPERPASFTVGVLRRDAFVVPFMTYDGKQWKNYWPKPAENADVPLSFRNVPKGWWGPAGPRESWQIWTPDTPPTTVKVRQPDWVSSYCHRVVGLRTDYQPRFRPPPLSVNPYPKDGLAVSPPRPVEPIEIVAPDSPEHDEVLEAIHARFSKLEHEALLNLPRAHASNPRLIPDPPRERDLLSMPPLTIEALYAHGTSHRVYFLEGAREYKKDGACTIVVLARGMVARESGKFSTDGINISIGYSACDRSGATYMWPLGVMSLPGGTYWIAQISGWNRESYSIIDITKGSKADDKSAPGGGC